MTSGEFSTISPDEIIILDRQRFERALDEISILADSITRLGLLHPLVLTRENVLIAGFRRLAAIKTLGWTAVPFQYEDSLDPEFHYLQEFEENEKRKDFTWKERCAAIERYHTIMLKRNPDWNQTKTATAMGLDKRTISDNIKLYKHKDNPLIAKETDGNRARNLAVRLEERAKADEHVYVRRPDNTHILNQSFLDFRSTEKFNLIHCDFPYGINADKAKLGSAAKLAGYDDSVEVYFTLLKHLSLELDSFCSPSAHMIFWFSMRYYQETFELLKLLEGFKFDPFPLIWWKNDNDGLLPDPTRGPRRVYETAFFGHRGDRKILRAKANAVGAPTSREIHSHEKPIPVLTHFFEMLVDENTRLFDPTAGSGSALVAAKNLGAQRVFGLEINKEHCEAANRRLSGNGSGL